MNNHINSSNNHNSNNNNKIQTQVDKVNKRKIAAERWLHFGTNIYGWKNEAAEHLGLQHRHLIWFL